MKYGKIFDKYVPNTATTVKDWLIRYAKEKFLKNYAKNPRFTREDALVMAFEELDDGWGIYIDPTAEEYQELLSEI